jgi:hypothetical protein
MTIHLHQDIEISFQAAVHGGHFASVDSAMSEAVSSLLQRLEYEQTEAKQTAASPAEGTKYKPIWKVAAEPRRSVPPEERNGTNSRLTEPPVTAIAFWGSSHIPAARFNP